MMAAKLEWVYKTRGFWSAGCREIWVDADGRFYTDGIVILGGHGLLDEAKAYCQAQEDAAAPPAELPSVGSVWGVPGKPGTWRHVHKYHEDGDIGYEVFGDASWDTPKNWQSWLQSTGAVRIDGDGDRVAALEAEVARLRKVERERDELKASNFRLRDTMHATETLTNAVTRERDDARARVAALEAEVVRLQASCEAWEARDARRQMAGKLDREALKTENVRLQNACDIWEKNSENAVTLWEALREIAQPHACGCSPCRGQCVNIESLEAMRDTAREALGTPAAKSVGDLMRERDDARAAVGRLLEALRGIEEHKHHTCPHPYPACIEWIQAKAREAIQREEGVES